MKLKDTLTSIGACSDALAWVESRTAREAWKDCPRGDWMLWVLGQAGLDRKRLVRICCDVALGVVHLSDDARVGACIDMALAWCDGDATDEQLRAAADAADAATAAYAADAATAAYAAAYAADASNAAAYAAYAAYAAAAATAAATYSFARTEALSDIADLVRRHVTAGEFERLIAKKAREP